MIIPSIDIMGGRAVQLRHGRELVIDGGDPMAWLERFAVVGEVAVVDLDAALGTGHNRALIRDMIRRADCRVGGGIRDLATARQWLDGGAARVMIGTAASPEFCRELPRDRVVAAVDAQRGTVVINGWRTSTGRHVLESIRLLAPYVGGFLLTQVEHEGVMAGFDMDLIEQAIAAAGVVRVTAAGGIRTPDHIRQLDALGADAQVGMALYTNTLTLSDAVEAVLRERDVLWPTIVSDESGRTLGLAWSNAASLAAAIRERSGIYWSRSRGTLWVKGESSGNRQSLLAVKVDCDRDALQFIVRQEGAGFCHEGTWSCFGDRFDVGVLERVIASRARSGDLASGTRRLFDDPVLLASKLREEADELAVAATPEEVLQESADLLYMLLTSAARAGVRLVDIEVELGRRHRRVSRRPMVAKP